MPKNSVVKSRPTVLVATTSRWYPTVRLAMALAKAGCSVEVVCPTAHPLVKTQAAAKIHFYHGLAPLHSFAAAIEEARPDLIIPGDDLAARHLHRLHARERSKRKSDSPICARIEHSLGAAENFPMAYERAAFMELACEQGIRVPNTEAIANLDDLKDWIVRNGFPAVLKANGTSGGDGVRVVRTVEEAERAFRSLQAPPRWLRAVKRAVVDHDATLLGPAFLRRQFVMNAQTFVAGREATSAVACWQGKVLAALHFEVINKRSAAGPATVVRLIENAEMSSAADKMVRRLNLSGLHGFDFMLEEQTGEAYLIEMNPRATQVGHLALGLGRDIPAALYAALSGKAVHPVPRVTENQTIALFPQEWIRDPESPFLRSAYHDIPWEEPELVRDCVSNRRRQSTWYSRANWKTSEPHRTPTNLHATKKTSCGVGLDWEAGKSRHE
ncbi:MAG: ATP-grasp domain-containing protein [Candidatus Sulfotelmatobacter sp.]